MTSTNNNDAVAAQLQQLRTEAIRKKQAGDVSGALALLQQARQLEFKGVSVESISDPAKLKQLAVFLKQQGDLEGAKQALLKSKQQQQQQQVGSSSASTTEPGKVGATTTTTTTSTKEDTPKPQETGPPSNDAPVETASIPTTKEDNNNDDEDIDDADLQQLQQELQENTINGDNDSNAIDFDPTAISFTDDELLDLEMMTEFKRGGMPVPSLQDYQYKIRKCQQDALACKQEGNTSKAVEYLRKAKQLKVVLEGLSQVQEGLGLGITDDPDDWLEELNQDDHELVRELFADASQSSLPGGIDGSNKNTVLELDDLQDMDPEDWKDALELGMELPTVADIQKQADEQRVLAVQLKRGGDLQGAKTALMAFKSLTQQAEKLEAMLETLPGTGSTKPITEEEMEAFLAGEAPNKPKQEPPKKAPLPKRKTAAELKEEVVRLRDSKKIKEATELLKVYKAALQREGQEAEMKQRKEIIQNMDAEITKAKEQYGLFVFYQRLVDEDIGRQQRGLWAAYAEQCTKTSKLVEAKGSNAVTVERLPKSALRVLPSDNISGFVQSGMDPSEERLEVSIVDVLDLQDNKSFTSILSNNANSKSTSSVLRVSVSIQLPLNEQETDKPIDLTFESSSSFSQDDDHESTPRHGFEEVPSQYVTLPRGESRFAKTVLRRMERRKIQILVHHHLKEEKRWFLGRSRDDSGSQPTLLGKVVLELNDLLLGTCIAGDFPLIGKASRKVGGRLRLSVRTGVAFDPLKLSPEIDNDVEGAHHQTSWGLSDLPVYKAMTFTTTTQTDSK